MDNVIVNDLPLEGSKQTARLLYIGHAVTFLFSLGMLNIIPLIINYIKRPETQGTFVYSHHSWMLRSFWIYIALAAVGWVMLVTIILIPLAWLLWVVAWIWYAYRLFRGFTELNSNRAME